MEDFDYPYADDPAGRRPEPRGDSPLARWQHEHLPVDRPVRDDLHVAVGNTTVDRFAQWWLTPQGERAARITLNTVNVDPAQRAAFTRGPGL